MEYFWIAVAAYFGWLTAPFILFFGVVALIFVAWLTLIIMALVEDCIITIKRKLWK